MWFKSVVFVALLLAAQSVWSSSAFNSLTPKTEHLHKLSAICNRISRATSSSSHVYYPGSSDYNTSISHYAISSTQHAACAFEPSTNNDIGIALQILGDTRTPFAIKSGGYSMNPDFSSTTGVHISLSRFRDIVIHPATTTDHGEENGLARGSPPSISIGPGLLWNEVYDFLEHTGVGVTGARVLGVGVGGFTLGGGYSWHTPQYGLAIDTLLSMDVVLPNGTFKEAVSATSAPELFFGLKGGFNNFGVVTRFVFKTFSQSDVWAGQIVYDPQHLPLITAALSDFAANTTDPRAGLINTFAYLPTQGGMINALLVFYDAPTPPPDVFTKLLAIPSVVNGARTQSFASFVRTLGSPVGNRGLLSSVSVKSFPTSFLEVAVNETKFWGAHLTSKSAISITFNVQPFLPTLFSHSNLESAYPPSRETGFYPLDINWSWGDEVFDEEVYAAVRESKRWLDIQAARLTSQENEQNEQDQEDDRDENANDDDGKGKIQREEIAIYPNYALPWTRLEDMYGSHLPRLRALKRDVDPENVMHLAGGFKF